jgi:hypothetical protein
MKMKLELFGVGVGFEGAWARKGGDGWMDGMVI